MALCISIHCPLKERDPGSSLHHPGHACNREERDVLLALLALLGLAHLTSHLPALLGGVLEVVGVPTVAPPVPAPAGVDRVHHAVPHLGEHHHDVVGLGKMKEARPLDVAVTQPASLLQTVCRPSEQMSELTIPQPWK